MRKNQRVEISSEFKIMVVDDDEGIVDAVKAMLNRSGYWCVGFADPLAALEELEREHYDLLVLDYFMQPIHGDAVVERIRKRDLELYILLLTGHKELAPPISTLKSLDIQAYCEKSDRTDQLQLLVESGIKSIAQMRTIKQFRDGLNSILGAVPSIYQLQPIGNILEEILRQLLPLVKGVDAFILIDELPELIDSPESLESADSSLASTSGSASVAGGEGEDALPTSGARSIFRGIGHYHVPVGSFADLLDHELMEAVGRARTDCMRTESSGGVIFPLVSSDLMYSMGVIYVNGVESEEGLKLLEIYAQQAASSISNAFLHSLVNTKNDELRTTYAQLKKRYMDTIEVLRLTVDAKDEYTRGHSDRVAGLAVKVGERLGYGEESLEELRIAGMFHDIGKIGTADDILLKNDRLSQSEFDEIKRHPMKGAMILSAVSMFEGIVPIVRHHHERIDGRGYPDGLAGEQIELSARIIAVVDAFDAMTSDRQYRSHLSPEAAKEQLRACAGSQFDLRVVELFLECLECLESEGDSALLA